MTFIEFIGFIITMAAMVFIFVRQAWENYRRRHYPQEYAEEVRRKDDALKKLLKSMDIEIEEEEDEEEEEPPRRRPQKKMPPPVSPQLFTKKPTVTAQQQRINTELQFKEYSSTKVDLSQELFQKDAYALNKVDAPPRSRGILSSLRSPKDMLVIKEILGPPRCDQEWI